MRLAFSTLMGVLWCASLNLVTLAHLAVGTAVSFAALALVARREHAASPAPPAPPAATPSPATTAPPSRSSLSRALRLVPFTAFMIAEVVKSCIAVARITLGPIAPLRPAILAVPTAGLSDAQITLLANMITLTPGTISLDVSPDKSHLYVHVLDAADPDAALRPILTSFRDKALEVAR